MTKNYFRRFVWSFLALLGVTVSALAVKGVVGNSLQTNEAERTVLYSWEGNADGAIESGGTATATDNTGADLTADDINTVQVYKETSYRVIRLRGAKDFSTYVININLDKELQAGDEIAITAMRNKNAADKQTGALVKFEKGSTNVSTVDASGLNGCEFVNINDTVNDKNTGTEPNTITLTVPEDAAGSKTLTLTRAVTGTNLFITKIVITGSRESEAGGEEGGSEEGGEGSGEGTTASFHDFSVNLVDILTTEQRVEKKAQDMYVAVAEDGTVSQTDAAEVATNVVHLVGTYWNDHGWTGTTATVKVDGPVAITLGRCGYGGGDIIVKNADGETVAQGAFENAGSGNYCYSAGKPENSTTVKYDGEATTLTITYPSYLPYIAVASYDPSKEWKWHDLSIDMVNGALTAEQRVDGTSYNFGLVDDDEGNLTQVDATADYANIVLDGKYHNSHGWTGTKATFKVEGPVEVSLGNCYYGSGTATLKNAAGEQVASVSLVDKNTCWEQDNSSVVTMKYTGEATTLTLEYNSYLPYIGVKAIEATAVSVTYSLDGVECEGSLLTTGGTYAAGDAFIVQAQNSTLYKEGYTLTGWTDGTNTYALGQKITLGEEDITLTPVFTANTVTLADRTEVTTVKFPVSVSAGSAKFNGSGFTVGQAIVGDATVDVKATIDASSGKFAYNKDQWTQVGEGTKITVPSYKGATVSLTSYQAFGADGKTATTIDGQSDYTSGTNITYTVASTAETIDIVFGSDAGYVTGNIVVVLPVPEKAFVPVTYDNETATINWPLNSSAADKIDAYTTTPEDAFSTIALNIGDLTVTGTGTRDSEPLADGITFVKFKPAGSTQAVQWVAKPARGLEFTPTKITMWIQRFGTDAKDGVTVSAKVGENGESITLGTYTARRNNYDDAVEIKKWGSLPSNITNKVEITLTEAQQQALTSGEGLTLSATVGVGSTKEGGFSNVTIEGNLNGTTEDVAKYTLAANVSDEAAGTVNIYPATEVYEEGTEVRLTATENFGYDFVNWTNAAGDVVSSEPVFTLAMTADSVLTANFVQVNTYELKLNVDGSNDYMVKINPAPTVVDDKYMYEEGTGVQLTAEGYDRLVSFSSWSDGQTNSNKTVSMTEDVELTAYYADNDIIAGWDFYKAGASGRKADFADADNETATLTLVNTSDDSDVQGWLDKSTIAANGYESFKGAAVNWRVGSSTGDVGNYHWQTKVNAENYTDINVQFQMMYNYNAYQKYLAEYSLDGQEWTEFGSITMSGAKAAASFSEKLPEAANNQANVYIRMRADKSSNVDGTASANDGNALAMFFITGTPKIVDDGTAPVLLSQVPAEGATGASATGKIVLTFNEKVKVAEGAVAEVNGLEITPVVSGKTVAFEYKGLEYGTDYTFSLPANSIGDLTDNYLAEAITINFTTMERPSVTKQLYDFIVPDDGTFKEALTAAAARGDKSKRFRIFVKKGDYVIPAGEKGYTDNNGNYYDYPDPRTYFNTPNVSIIGEDPATTTITNEMPNSLVANSQAGAGGQANPCEGIRSSGVLYLQSGATDTYFQDIKLWSATADNTGRNVVLVDGGNRTVCKNVTLWAYQDTYVPDNSQNLYYFEDGIVRGRTDFVCGSGDVFFNSVNLIMCEEGGYLSVPRDNVKYGFVYKDCTIDGNSGVDGNYYLGRAWTAGAESYFIDTKMNVVPKGEGWSDWNNGPTRFAEYNSMTASGSQIDLTSRKTSFASDGSTNKPILTAEEALEIGNLHNMFGDWDPTLLTEQAPAVKNVILDGNNLTWDDSNYALNYAIVKNGSVVAFTTENSFDISTVDTSAGAKASSLSANDADVWAVRAANEMGGLNEAVEATIATAVSEVEAAPVKSAADGKVYNVAGQEVSASYKGIVIINGKKIVK